MFWKRFAAVALFLAGCDGVSERRARVRNYVETAPAQALSTSEGALVSLSMQSTVGVLLDEVPGPMRNRLATALMNKPTSYWTSRAKAQTRLATYRLVFREFFYSQGKKQLPLPPENLWRITLIGTPRRQIANGHDLVVVDYRFDSTLLTDQNSPGISEPKLAKVGGTWSEPFIFPLDPELLFQRTGFACMDEEDFPYNTVDSEETDTYYDHTCTVEKELSNHGCHQTQMPTMSCVQALKAKVGKIDTALLFTRLPWDGAVAASVRVAPATSPNADMEVYLDDFLVNRTEYKYFEPGSCELQEQCIGAPGWRRVLQFNSSDQNRGASALDIGPIDYYLTGTQTLNDLYNIFELHQCHGHYHFTHYGQFSYAAASAATNKQGFCLQSTNRAANSETSPLHNPYGGCDYQGVSAGWVDQYKIGLPCQWVDVTDVDTRTAPVTSALTFTSNPDGFLCEGKPVTDALGNPVFELTQFLTHDGEPVWRPKCEFTPGWFDNNTHSYDATVPKAGESYVTQACDRGQVGPLRNCGLSAAKDRLTCTPGQPVKLRCTVVSTAAPQVARICERSNVLDTGLACTHRSAMASVAVDGAADVTFTCPAGRSAAEPGGTYSLYTGPVSTDDASAKVTCTSY